MSAKVVVDAGICGFHATIRAFCDDGQNVTFDIKSGCERIKKYSEALAAHGSVDAFATLIPNQPNPVLVAAGQTITGCCTSCVVPLSVFRAMQVAAGLALPKNISLEISKED